MPFDISPLPSIDRLNELFDVDLETGAMNWKVDRGRTCKAGQRAGSVQKDGSLSVMIDGKRYKVHRLLWKLATGNDPTGFIDHEKGNPEFSGIDNLRDVTPCQSAQNTKTQKNSTTGVKGVYLFDNGHNTYYLAKFTHNRKIQYCGYYKTIDDASAAIRLERDKLQGEFACHGNRRAA